MALLSEDIDCFKRGEQENPRFWLRLGGRPALAGASVLDVGCGHGSLCVDVALHGARKVVGLDTDVRRIAFAAENLSLNYSHLTSAVEFKCADLVNDNDPGPLDYIVSKDTFEHIVDLAQVLAEMKRRLKPGGRIYAGFGPLYNSPFGGHRRMRVLIPWSHLLVPERITIRRLNRRREVKIKSIHDLGLNKMSLAGYEKVFRESGLSIVFFRVNHSARIISRIFSAISKVPFLREYFSHNIYCILEKPK